MGKWILAILNLIPVLWELSKQYLPRRKKDDLDRTD